MVDWLDNKYFYESRINLYKTARLYSVFMSFEHSNFDYVFYNEISNDERHKGESFYLSRLFLLEQAVIPEKETLNENHLVK